MAIQTTRGFYVGNEFKSEGAKKNKEGVEGKWQRMVFKFKPTIQSDKSFSMTVFLPWSGKMGVNPADLKVGTEYAISYTESEFTAQDGSPAKSKKAVGFFDATNLPKESKETHMSQVTPMPELLTKWPAFKERYQKQVPKEKQSDTHMLGAFVRTYMAKTEPWMQLIELAKNTYPD